MPLVAKRRSRNVVIQDPECHCEAEGRGNLHQS
jgi:hypothetical protein